MFNQKLARYYSRKQQFTDAISNQQVYQTPIDCVRIMGMTYAVTNTYNPTVKEIRSEYEWRQITSYRMATNWPTYYFMIGSDEFALWPIPSQTTTNGIRFYYQPQDHDLTLDDVTSTSTSATVSVTNGTPTVTGSSTVFNPDMASLGYQTTGVTDTTWYEIVNATSSILTLKSAYVGTSGSGFDWRIGQLPIIPQEYQDAPMHWALYNFFSAAGNEQRASQHFAQYNDLVTQCMEDYSSSNESSVIDNSDSMGYNIWLAPPNPGM